MKNKIKFLFANLILIFTKRSWNRNLYVCYGLLFKQNSSGSHLKQNSSRFIPQKKFANTVSLGISIMTAFRFPNDLSKSGHVIKKASFVNHELTWMVHDFSTIHFLPGTVSCELGSCEPSYICRSPIPQANGSFWKFHLPVYQDDLQVYHWTIYFMCISSPDLY